MVTLREKFNKLSIAYKPLRDMYGRIQGDGSWFTYRVPLNRVAEFARFIDNLPDNLSGHFPDGLMVNVPFKGGDDGSLWDAGVDGKRSTTSKLVVGGNLGASGYGGYHTVIISVSKPPKGVSFELEVGTTAAKIFLGSEKLRKMR